MSITIDGSTDTITSSAAAINVTKPVAVTGTIKGATTIGVGNATPAASGAGITFPATQSASSDVNTLDDYEEGTCTLGITFATPGNLAVTYGRNSARYTKVGRLVTITEGSLVTSAFTHTTASGELIITGLPFSAPVAQYSGAGLVWSGITKAGFTSMGLYEVSGSATLNLIASGSGVTYAYVTAADTPTGGTVTLEFQFSYTV